jgi:hypothetical protein
MNKTRRMRWAGYVARMGEKGNKYRILVGKGGRTIIKWILEKQMDSMDWIDLAEDRDQWRALVNKVMNLRFP